MGLHTSYASRPKQPGPIQSRQWSLLWVPISSSSQSPLRNLALAPANTTGPRSVRAPVTFFCFYLPPMAPALRRTLCNHTHVVFPSRACNISINQLINQSISISPHLPMYVGRPASEDARAAGGLLASDSFDFSRLRARAASIVQHGGKKEEDVHSSSRRLRNYIPYSALAGPCTINPLLYWHVAVDGIPAQQTNSLRFFSPLRKPKKINKLVLG
ncbi:hypothetical protein F4815DRAFT_389763 [Daldinia loculata]|nr:hypothetical protein F4815DRAFT_389763 [Daldinia loculata]